MGVPTGDPKKPFFVVEIAIQVNMSLALVFYISFIRRKNVTSWSKVHAENMWQVSVFHSYRSLDIFSDFYWEVESFFFFFSENQKHKYNALLSMLQYEENH